MPSTDQITAQLDRLASFDSGPFPVLSLYLNAQPDQHGRDNFDAFLRKELAARVRTYPADSPERQSLEQDAEKVRAYVAGLDPAANGVAIFSCAAADLFEAVQLAAPIPEHRLYVSSEPHLYPLARLADEYPRYAVLVADTNRARIFVVAANAVQARETVENTKTRGQKMGGWSQARYQRRVQNDRAQHAREVADVLTRLVRDEGIASVIIAGDDVVVPLLRDEFPKELSARILDTVALDIRAPEHEILQAAQNLVQQKDTENDRERVEALFDAYRGNGLGVVGPEAVRTALEMGQVEELLITGVPASLDAQGSSGTSETAPAERTPEEQVADELIAKARQTAARITIVQDGSLLEAVGGVGALLRFKL
ncbi:MAG: host attachment protein [Acidobacteria bacterium]|nr:host attachment protein [Acidobacteriota bacterium]